MPKQKTTNSSASSESKDSVWEVIKTMYAVQRSEGRYRMTEGRALRCKVCGDVFVDIQEAKAHKHEVR